jgi:plastocyanin
MTRLALMRRAFLFGGMAIGTVVLGAGLVGRALDVKTVDMHDVCDPQSFNDMFGDVCFSSHPGVNVDTFLHVLANAHKMGAWHFAPGVVRLRSGQAFQAHNSGGEAHTFTEVDDFAGGFIPELNDLVGETEIAPECDLASGATPEFIGPGGDGEPEVESPGTHKYMCCIHPWMRATVTVR